MITMEHLVVEGSREWAVQQEITGWRLMFKDPGDSEWTNAGVFPSRPKAVGEAERRLR